MKRRPASTRPAAVPGLWARGSRSVAAAARPAANGSEIS